MRTLGTTLRRAAMIGMALSLGVALLRLVRPPVPWPDWYRRLVCRANPVAYRLGMVGHRRSPLASIEYVGRKSGNVRQTPVWAFVTADHVLIGLPYGRDVNWVRNVRAGGHCRLQHRGRVYELDEPRIRHSDEVTELPQWRTRQFSSRMDYLRLRVFRSRPGTLDAVEPETDYTFEAPAVEPVS